MTVLTVKSVVWNGNMPAHFVMLRPGLRDDWCHGTTYYHVEADGSRTGYFQKEWLDAGQPPAHEQPAMHRALLNMQKERVTAPRPEDIQIVARMCSNGSFEYAVCDWEVLYDHLCTLRLWQRQLYGIVLDRHNIWGVPLLLDFDGQYENELGITVFPTREEFMTGVRRAIEALGGDPRRFLTDDAASSTGSKQSVHTMSRLIAFRSAEHASFISKALKEHVCPWIDAGIPKTNGLLRMVGCPKPDNKRAQRPNPGLLDLLRPVTADDRFQDIVSRAEFRARRLWLSKEEADAAWWPQGIGEVLPQRPVLGKLREYYLRVPWDALRTLWGQQLRPYYVDTDKYIVYPGKSSGGLALVTENDFLLCAVRVVPDPARWLVVSIALRPPCPAKTHGHGRTCYECLYLAPACRIKHESYTACEVCWALARSKVYTLVERLAEFGSPHCIIYGGAGTVDLWLGVDNRKASFVLAHPGARTLLAERILPGLGDLASERRPVLVSTP